MSIVRKATEAQIAFLRNSGASFKIILSDGEIVVHDPNGLIDPQKKPIKRGPSRNPEVQRGEPTSYVTPYMENLEPGQTATIPCKYHFETMRSVVCNNARFLWGSKNYMTEFDEKRKNIIVLRVN
jgi:hypothetical protein